MTRRARRKSERPISDDKLPRAALATFLRRNPLFASLDRETLAATVDAFDVVAVPGGTSLLDAGQRLDALLTVLHGGLRVIRRRDDGSAQTVREFYRGDTLGTVALLSEGPLPVDLFAIRDSTILRLPRARFFALTREHPPLLEALARLMGERAFGVLEALVESPRDAPAGRGGNVAVFAASDPVAREVQDQLIALALEEPRRTLVTAELVDRTLGAGAADGEDARLTAWMSNLEGDADVVLYECDPLRPRWTARCQRQSDRLVLIAPAGAAPSFTSNVGRVMGQPHGLSRPIDLVLVHPASAQVPSGTSAWHDVPDLRAIHHVRRGHRGDLERAVRRLLGRPTGLVLSGGGARGIAHVGAIAAIVEAGIPIDYVCGTSMGAIFAATLALGFDIRRMRTEVSTLFDRPFSLYDLTVPISSLLAGNKLDRVLEGQFGDTDIEDLWLPFFCVSTDLARAKLVVHDRGCLWKSVRASCSIPGIFPPLAMDGQTLVDGGLVDNLPLDLLMERCPGPIIAVDVFPYGDPSFTQPTGRAARWLRGLRTVIRGAPASPPLFDILFRATLVGSKFRQQVAMDRAREILYLEPPVASFGALQWRAHRALFEAGHRYTAEQLVDHRSMFARG